MVFSGFFQALKDSSLCYYTLKYAYFHHQLLNVLVVGGLAVRFFYSQVTYLLVIEALSVNYCAELVEPKWWGINICLVLR